MRAPRRCRPGRSPTAAKPCGAATSRYRTGWSASNVEDWTQWVYRKASANPCAHACFQAGIDEWVSPYSGAGNRATSHEEQDASVARNVACMTRCGLVPEVTHGPDWKVPIIKQRTP